MAAALNRTPIAGILLIGVLLRASQGSAADITAPICGRPDVLETVATIVARQGGGALIDPQVLGEEPAPARDTTRCRVFLQRTVYDTGRSGFQPLIIREPFDYRVRRGFNGWFVDAPG